MAPTPDLVITIDPGEVGSETVRTVVLPWSGQSTPLRIPAGVTDGTVLHLPGMGPAEVPGGPPRDAYVQIRVGSAAGTGPTPAAEPGTAPLPPGAAGAPFGTPPGAAAPTVQFGTTPPTTPFSAPPMSGSPYGATGQPGPHGAAQPGIAPGAYSAPPSSPGGRGKILVLVGAAVAVVLLAVVAIPVLYFANRDPDRTPTAGGPSGSTPSPSVTPISPQEYQQLLAEIDKSVGEAFTRLGAAKNPKAVRQAADALETAIESQRQTLAEVVPPPTVADAHEALLDGLEGLGRSAADTESAAGSGEVCLGSAAVARLSRDDAAEDLRSATQVLATADPAQAYQVGSFVPKKTADTNRRLSNGKYLKRTRGGAGQLKIENGGSDAVINVVLGNSKTPAISVYVRGKGKFTVSGVRDGTYRIYMTSGKDWDPKAKAFARDCSFQRFEDTFQFRTTSTQYTIWTITLTPVVGGNARTSDVDPSTFPGS